MEDYRQEASRYIFGFGALLMAAYFMLRHFDEPVVFFASLFFLVICATDTLSSKIPNVAVLSLVLVGFGYHLGTHGMPGGLTALTGMLMGLILLLVPYLMGGMGGGDVKALAALGTLLGPGDIFQVFVLAGLIGGFMALIHLALSNDLQRRFQSYREKIWLILADRSLPKGNSCEQASAIRYPYGAAIAFGFFAFAGFGGLV